MATTVPLTYMGLTSLKYTGTTSEAIPTPSPTMTLPIIRAYIDPADIINMAPRVNKTSAIIITVFLPTLSLTGPAINDPMNAPNCAKLTISSVSSFVISGQVSSK